MFFVAGRKFGENVLIHFLLEEEVAKKNWEFLPVNSGLEKKNNFNQG